MSPKTGTVWTSKISTAATMTGRRRRLRSSRRLRTASRMAKPAAMSPGRSARASVAPAQLETTPTVSNVRSVDRNPPKSKEPLTPVAANALRVSWRNAWPNRAAKPPRPARVAWPLILVARVAVAAAAPAINSDVINWARSISKPMSTSVVLEDSMIPEATAEPPTAAATATLMNNGHLRARRKAVSNGLIGQTTRHPAQRLSASGAATATRARCDSYSHAPSDYSCARLSAILWTRPPGAGPHPEVPHRIYYRLLKGRPCHADLMRTFGQPSRTIPAKYRVPEPGEDGAQFRRPIALGEGDPHPLANGLAHVPEHEAPVTSGVFAPEGDAVAGHVVAPQRAVVRGAHPATQGPLAGRSADVVGERRLGGLDDFEAAGPSPEAELSVDAVDEVVLAKPAEALPGRDRM